MVGESQSYNNLKLDVTDTPSGNSSSAAGGCPAKEKAEDLILECLMKSDIELEPEIIAFQTGIKPSTARGTCRRLHRKLLISRNDAGYFIARPAIDDHLGKLLKIDGTSATLPKVHDLHLTLKPKNVLEAMKNPAIWDPLSQVSYSLPDRGPEDKKLRKVYRQSYKPTPPLSGIKWLDKLLNTLDPDSIFVRWEERGDPARMTDRDGGFQEKFDFKIYRITFTFIHTGTVMIAIGNSEHPFDALGLREALASVDGIFVSRIGIRFADISNLFYIEQVHIGNDVVSDRGFEGVSRLNYTINQVDGWLYRCYEKVLDGDPVVRSEACLKDGNFKDHNMNAFAAFVQGNLTPQLINAQIFKLTDNQVGERELMRRQQNEIHDMGKWIMSLAASGKKTDDKLDRLMDQIGALVGKVGGVDLPPIPAPKKADGTGPDKELAPEKAGAYLGKLKAATPKKAKEKSTPLTKEETWQVLDAFEKIRKKEGS